MQTQALPIQLSSASTSPAPARANSTANADSAQFSQALSREMDQRQHGAAPVAASQPAPAKPQAGAPAQARAADGKADADEASDDAADAAAVTPVTDMLALVASFNQLVAAAPAADPAAAAIVAQAAGVPGAAGKQPGGDAIAAIAGGAADGKELPLKDGAPLGDAAGAFALKMLPADAPQKGAVAVRTASSESVRADDALDAVAGAAVQKSDADGAGAAAFRAAADKAALQGAPVQPEQLRTREADVAALKDLPAAAPLTAPAQQASAAITQAVAGAPGERIAARVGTPAWDNQVGQKIVWMVAGKEQSASLTLNPPDMGPMQVVLSVTNDQATVTFTAAQPEVRQALENAMPKLREMMGESGIALGNATVNAGSPDQRQAQQGEQSRGGGSGGRFGGGGGGEPAIAAVTARPVRAGGEGLVDTFA